MAAHHQHCTHMYPWRDRARAQGGRGRLSARYRHPGYPPRFRTRSWRARRQFAGGAAATRSKRSVPAKRRPVAQPHQAGRVATGCSTTRVSIGTLP